MSAKVGTYLDSNAGAPLKAAAREALFSLFKNQDSFVPNPSSIHSFGRFAKRELSLAREKVALSLGPKVDPEQLIFTSSGTEANQLAVRSVLESKLLKGEKPRWVTTAVEHDSNRQMIAWLESRGGSVSLIPVNSAGVPQIEWLRGRNLDRNREMLNDPATSLVSMIWVNNETGVITDIAQVVRIMNEMTRDRRIPFHIDAAQAWGKLPFEVDSLGAQCLSFSGHKIGGLAGSGLLWVAPGFPAYATILGKQEKGRRGGTENSLGIISMGAAASTLEPREWVSRVGPLRDRLQNEICNRISGVIVNGEDSPRVANTLNLSFEGIEGDGLVMALDLAGYAVSAGSACSSGVLEPSHVLMAMGRTKTQAMAAIRISIPDVMEWEKLEGFVMTLENVVHRMRRSRK